VIDNLAGGVFTFFLLFLIIMRAIEATATLMYDHYAPRNNSSLGIVAFRASLVAPNKSIIQLILRSSDWISFCWLTHQILQHLELSGISSTEDQCYLLVNLLRYSIDLASFIFLYFGQWHIVCRCASLLRVTK